MGREFLDIFTDWSSDYDEFVEGKIQNTKPFLKVIKIF